MTGLRAIPDWICPTGPDYKSWYPWVAGLGLVAVGAALGWTLAKRSR